MPDYTLYPFDTAPRVPFRFDGRILFTSDRFELVHLTLQPGEGMEPHIQPMEIVFFVAEGAGTLAVGRELIEVAPQTTIKIEAGIPRSWTNTGNIQLKILVGKLLPPPRNLTNA
ncbi:MAG: cupin domain-containing protein [Bacteroidota bacterium]